MPNTTNYDFGDVLLMEVFFTNQQQSQRRPVVVISTLAYNQSHPDIIVMPVTSQSHQSASAGATPIQGWQQAGLNKPSFVKPVIGTYEQGKVIKQLGKTDPATRVALRKAVAYMLGFRQAPVRSSST